MQHICMVRNTQPMVNNSVNSDHHCCFKRNRSSRCYIIVHCVISALRLLQVCLVKSSILKHYKCYNSRHLEILYCTVFSLFCMFFSIEKQRALSQLTDYPTLFYCWKSTFPVVHNQNEENVFKQCFYEQLLHFFMMICSKMWCFSS